MSKGTIIVIVICFLLFLLPFIVSGFDIGDSVPMCNENDFLRVIGGRLICYTEPVLHYAEGYFHNHTEPYTITIVSENTYYNVSNFTASNVVGIEFENQGVTIKKNATYLLSASISFFGGNGGEYDFIMTKNQIPLLDCAIARTTSSTALGNVGLTCITDLIIGDHLNLKIEDLNAPAQDVTIELMNLNIIELR